MKESVLISDSTVPPCGCAVSITYDSSVHLAGLMAEVEEGVITRSGGHLYSPSSHLSACRGKLGIGAEQRQLAADTVDGRAWTSAPQASKERDGTIAIRLCTCLHQESHNPPVPTIAPIIPHLPLPHLSVALVCNSTLHASLLPNSL